MSVGRESIRRAANAGAGKTVKKPVVSTKEAEKPETISVTVFKKKELCGNIILRHQQRNIISFTLCQSLCHNILSVTEEKKKTAKGFVHINEELPVYLL